VRALRRLAVNLLGIDRPVSGVERFAQELAPGLILAEPPGWHVTFALEPSAVDRSDLHRAIAPDRRLVIPRAPFGAPGRHTATQLLLPLLLRRHGVDVLFSPMGVGPIVWRRQIVMVHDHAWRHFPAAYRPSYRGLHRLLEAGYRLRGTTVAAGSAAIAAEHHHTFRKSKVVIIPYGPGRVAASANGAAVSPHRVLWVGSHDRRKHLAMAVAACERAATQTGWPLELVVAGRQPRTLARISETRPTSYASVRFLRPDDAQLENLYATSRLLLCTSEYEGYGLPVAEAVARGVPVVSSPVPSALELEHADVRVVRELTPAAFADAIVDELGSGPPRRTPTARRSWEDVAAAVWRTVCELMAETP
jgi:glycosyltransferase involved in cell wall biosynthesis